MSARRATIDLENAPPPAGYRFLISAIVPRPIAWITTVDRDGRSNLAPFSFYQGVSGDPPVLMVSFAKGKRSGEPKDTLANIERTGEFVVNGVTEALLDPMVLSSGEYEHGVSEIELAGLRTFPAERVRPPCLEDAPFSLECRELQRLAVGGCTVVFGRVLCAHVREELLDEKGRIDAARLKPVGRLGGALYAVCERIVEKRARGR